MQKLIGIIGAGQLGRMLAQAGSALGFDFRFLANADHSACEGLGEILSGDWHQRELLQKFCKGLDYSTFEFENVELESAEVIASLSKLRPSLKSLQVSQDRVLEKTFLKSCGLQTADFCAVDSLQDLQNAAEKLGFPFVLKTRRLGYDGKGQIVLKNVGELSAAFQNLGAKNLIAEEFVAFQREVSIVAVRAQDCEVRYYPLTQNFHQEGILRLSFAPTAAPASLKKVQELVGKVLRELDYCGVLAIEFFERDGELIANEMAPRVHNSGHWTIDGAKCSQFENHIRAVAGLTLAETELGTPSIMLNLIGELPAASKVPKDENVHLHLYGKAPRAGRKVGHITITDSDTGKLKNKALHLAQELLPAHIAARIKEVLELK